MTVSSYTYVEEYPVKEGEDEEDPKAERIDPLAFGVSPSEFSYGLSCLNQLKEAIQYQPFKILGEDPDGVRYTAGPNDAAWESAIALASRTTYYVKPGTPITAT